MPSQRKRQGEPGASKAVAFSVREFFARFPDDDACLEHIMRVRHGLRHPCDKCLNLSTFHRLAERPAYSCAHCGHHVYPCAGTIFEDTRTPLQMWFYAIYLFVTTRHGVSGKELQRTLGVTYKTAWRIGHKIRELIASTEGFDLLQGHIEVDEAYVGGKRPGKRGRGAEGKTIVVGMKERGGDIRAKAVPDASKATLKALVKGNVEPGSTVGTDEFASYGLLEPEGYKHGQVQHAAKEYAYYDWSVKVLHHTNNVENFWRLFKNSVRSTHIHVSAKYMDRYLNEFTFRLNHREMKNAMFDLLIGAV
jgi:transposase-like protein